MHPEKKIIDEEVKWDKSKTIVSRTDQKGMILYVNQTFEIASEYNKMELIGEPHNIIRHPDMPKVVYKKLWDSLNAGKNYHAIVKNLTRTGRYYWVITDFVIEQDKSSNIIGFTGRRKAISPEIVSQIEPLYKTLLSIEKAKGELASELYFDAYLEEEVQKEYEEFVLDLFAEDVSLKGKKSRKGIWKNFFFSTYTY